MLKPIVGGNWKMNTNGASARALTQAVADSVAKEQIDRRCDVCIFPPFVYLQAALGVLRERSSAVMLGAQDAYFQPDGAFTGEVSIAMLKDVGVGIVLAGHSERRHVIGETDEIVNRKVRAILNGGLMCILCVGETLAQREKGETDQVNQRQLAAGLQGVTPEQMSRVVIAYEPVWAIGTGKAATVADAQDAHAKIRGVLKSLYGSGVAEATRIQYGGSATHANVAGFIAQPDIDGGLVGGASLKPEDFAFILRTVAAART